MDQNAMDSKMLWINEGYVLDEAGNLISTSYVDLRAPGSRRTIQTLVKGCRREHALENAETILVSPVARFRAEGENLIRDDQEGLATEKTETIKPEMPKEAFERRRIAHLNEAIELLDSKIRITRRVTSRSVERSEEVADDAVHGRKALQMSRRFEAAHLPLARAGRLMGDFDAVVRIRGCAVDDRRHHGVARGRGAAQLVGDQAAGETARPFE